jgi:hypothetical protein
MSLCAILPAAQMAAANAALEALGRGPRNFGVAAYAGVRPGWAGLHAWGDAAFIAEIKALAGVVWEESDGVPRDRFAALCLAQGARWGADAPPLPDEGTILPGEIYFTGDLETLALWRVVQQHDRGTFGGDPAQYPALIRRARIPGVPAPWVQPLDAFDAYLLLDPFTGEAEQAIHEGQVWRVTQQSAAGGFNTFPPGVFGWEVVT